MEEGKVPFEFNPDKSYFLYFVRQGLYNAVLNNRHHLIGKMMDFGCGSMPYKSLFNVDEYIGVDFEKSGHSHKNKKIDVTYDGKKIPFESNYFDSILATEVIEHVFNIDEVLLELNRVLKPNGKILVTCPFIWEEHEIPFDYARYTHFSLKYLFEKSGFEVLIFEKSGNYVTVIGQLLNCYCKKVRFLNRFTHIINILFSCLNKYLPKKDTVYISNIIVARKI
jgi:ubiquinone/menaquinone biosynthesis C-methylase UbiE